MSIDKSNPAHATIKERYLLTKPGSSKETYHIVLDTSNAPLTFKVGDSVGVYAQNDPLLVQHLIEAMRATGEELILDSRSNQTFPLRYFLTHKANLARLTSSFLKCIHAHSPSQVLAELLANKPLLTEYLHHHDPLSLFKEYAAHEAPLQELCAQFGPLLPRFYSIASSPLTHPNEVHLTVALTTYTHAGELRYGVASHFLSHLATLGETTIPLYVHPAAHFSLPDPHVPIIMIGPGTGIAPFRGFLQERLHTQASGKNWLFFGERNRDFDYFYADFFESHPNLRLNLAFSRDQADKLYVQHLMQEHAADLWSWLQEGASLYVCGDAHRMAKDVEATLRQIAQNHGSLSEDQAKGYIKQLRADKRYLLDIY